MWYRLALALGGRSVAEWKDTMSAAEFIGWCEFYRDHPFDDFHRFHRPAALLAASKGFAVQQALDWLAPPRLPEGVDSVGLSIMRALGVNPEAR